jgi:hypothetical protein
VNSDLKATVTKNTGLLYKRAGVFDRAAELFRLAAEMEDGVANAARRSTCPRACTQQQHLFPLFFLTSNLYSLSESHPSTGTSLLLAASAYAAHGHHAATSECAMQALLTTSSTLFLPCQRRPEISQVPSITSL